MSINWVIFSLIGCIGMCTLFISLYRKIVGQKVFLPVYPQPSVKLWDSIVAFAGAFVLVVVISLMFGIPHGSVGFVLGSIVGRALIFLFAGVLIFFPVEFALTKLVKKAEPALWPHPTRNEVIMGLFIEVCVWAFLIMAWLAF